MPGWISDDQGSTSLEAEGTDTIASTAASTQDWFGLTKQIGRGIRRADSDLSEAGSTTMLGDEPLAIQPPNAPPPPTPETMLTAEEANKQYKIVPPSGAKGLSFDGPVAPSVAQDMYNAKRDELERNDAMARRPNTFGATLGNVGTGLAAGLLDPVNIAASVVPVVGEARVAGLLARVGVDAAGSLAERTLVRGVAGAASGIAAQTPLVGLRYGLSQQDQQDYSAMAAMGDIAMGGLLGGGLHTLIGATGDLIGSRFRDSPQGRTVDAVPEARDAALRASVAAVSEDRPVDVSALIDLHAANAAQADLAKWVDQQGRITNDTDAALAAAEPGGEAPVDRSAQISATSDRLTQLRAEQDSFRSELGGVRRIDVNDPETAQRLSDIQTELQGVTPAARRAQLLDEQRMLQEGPPSELDQARDAQQAQGLQTGLDRVSAQADSVQAELDQLQAQDAEDQARTAALKASSDRGLRIEAAKLASREAVVQALTERSIRRFAGSRGVTLAPGEAESAARNLLTGDGAKGKIAALIDDISKRDPDREGYTPSSRPPAADAMAALKAEYDGAFDQISKSDAVRRAGGELDDPTYKAASDAADRAGKEMVPTETPPEPDPDTMAGLERAIRDADARGDLDADSQRELEASDAAGKEAESMAKAYEAAASCMLSRIL